MRKLGFVTATLLVVMTAVFTGATYVYFFMYLGIVTVGLAYLIARRGLSSLEAGSWLDRHQATVGDTLTVTYTLRSLARLPKPWLEVHSPSTLPVAIPGRVISLGSRTARTWAARVPLSDRGQYRVDPMVVRTGDPFGFFESTASVGPGAALLVHPRIEPLPGWRLQPTQLDGVARRTEFGSNLTPLVTSVRPYTTGDAFNRIHWRSSARHQELQVKEFDIEQSADLWIFLDLERVQHGGSGASATIETVVKAAAAISAHALADDRSVGLECVGLRRALISSDRGARQQQKIMSLLAVVQAEGTTPLAELLLESAARHRRGAIAGVITPSLDRSWVKPLAAMRGGGVSPTACIVDPLAHAVASLAAAGQGQPQPTERQPFERDLRALRHALNEHDVSHHNLVPGVPLGEQLISSADRQPVATTP